MATAAVDGARLHYDVGGERPALLLSHGFSANLDQPEAFNRVRGDFLAALPPDPA